MIRLPKSVLSFRVVALVACGLTLAVPRAARSFAAALVDVTNTAANPAITQSAPSQAAQLVSLIFISQAGAFQQIGSTQNYVVGAQSLVITDVDISTFGCSAGLQTFNIDVPNLFDRFFAVTTFDTAHFSYRSGFVLPPGSVPSLVSSCPSASLQLDGYLTSN